MRTCRVVQREVELFGLTYAVEAVNLIDERPVTPHISHVRHGIGKQQFEPQAVLPRVEFPVEERDPQASLREPPGEVEGEI